MVPLQRSGREPRYRRYERPIPRIACNCKIGQGLYQYTTIDDCSRFLVVALYPKRTATHTLDFLKRVVEQMPFPIQRLQTDNGREFTAYPVQDILLEWGIKFRPIRPASPHLNGKVERAQKTVLDEFYPTIDLEDPHLPELLEQCQFYYNWQRVHGSLGKTPMGRCLELYPQTPFWEDVSLAFDPEREAELLRRRQLRRHQKVK